MTDFDKLSQWDRNIAARKSKEGIAHSLRLAAAQLKSQGNLTRMHELVSKARSIECELKNGILT